MLRISFLASGPLRSLRVHLQRHGALVRESGAGALAHLVWGKAEELAREAQGMLAASFMEGVLENAPLSIAPLLHPVLL
eukprot:157230-Alexandrium_andersonii.AAC.1